jgi:RNA polymerase sigma factor (sigma-70 family)
LNKVVSTAPQPSENPVTPPSETDHSRWFVEEMHPHESSLRSYLHGSFPAVRDVDDVVQESFLRVWRARAAQPIASARAFLFKVARHLALDLLRHERRSPIDGVGDLATLNVSEERRTVTATVSRNEKIQLLIAAIDALPPRCRQVVILRKLKFVPQREVAELLGISEKGVEIQLTRGLARCRDYLQKRGVSSLFDDET